MKKLSLLLCIFWYSLSQAYIFSINELVSPDKEQHVFLLYDNHKGHGENNAQQRNDLLKVLGQLKDRILIVEDMMACLSPQLEKYIYQTKRYIEKL